MKIALAVFVKTIGLSEVKTRLAATIGKEKAEGYFVQCVTHMRQVMRQVIGNAKHDITPRWAVAEQEAVSHEIWQDFQAIHTGDGELGERLHHIYSSLLAKYNTVILMGSDSPQVQESHIISAIDNLKTSDFVFGSTYDGGFYLFASRQSIPKEIWTSVAYSQNDTLEQLIRQLNPLGNIFYIEKLHDLDEQKDLQPVGFL